MRVHYIVIASLILLSALSLPAAERPYSRYEPIVTRAPFGKVPVNFDPTVNPSTISARTGANGEKELTAEQADLKKKVKFSAINLDPEGVIRVGFSDLSSAKTPRHYYLKVGECRDGWTVVEADAAARRVKLTKDGIELELDLGNEATGSGVANSTPRADIPTAQPAALNKRAVSEASTESKRPSRLLSRRGRLAEKKEMEEKRKAEQLEREKQAKIEREEMREQLAALSEEVRQNREREKMKAAETAAPAPEPAPAAEGEEPPPPPPPEEGGEAESGE